MRAWIKHMRTCAIQPGLSDRCFLSQMKKEMKPALKSRGMKISKNFKSNMERSVFKEQSRNPQILEQKRDNVSERWLWEETPQLSRYSNQLAREGKPSNIISDEALLEACERLESQDITTHSPQWHRFALWNTNYKSRLIKKESTWMKKKPYKCKMHITNVKSKAASLHRYFSNVFFPLDFPIKDIFFKTQLMVPDYRKA